jgi:hypothetical protein
VTSWQGVRWAAAALVLLSAGRGIPCSRDESLGPHSALPSAKALIDAPLPVASADTAQVGALAALVGAPALDFVRHDLNSSPFAQVTEGINVGDIDGDGRPDLVVGGDQYLLWYHNPDWTPNLIANGYKFAGGAMVVVRDMDGDGRLDVLTGRYIITDPAHRQMVWYGNTPSGWAPHVVSNTSYCHDMAFADLDGDGRPDTACDDHVLKQIVWLQAPAVPTSLWTTHLIDSRGAMGADVADIDRDGHVDVIAGRAWYRNDGAGNFVRYPYTTLTDTADTFFNDYEKVNAIDLDGDGRLDIFATLFANSREGQVWAFLAPADPRQSWTGVQIDPGPLFGVHSQAVARFDGTSRPQVMVAETNIGGYGFGVNPSPQMYVYRLLGAASDPAGWERTQIDSVGTHEARAVDLNGDGLPDIAGGEENTDLVSPPRNGQVSWWQNATATGSATTTTTPTGTTTSRPATTTTPTTTLPGGIGQLTRQPDGTSGADNQMAGGRNTTANYGAATFLCVGNDRANSERVLIHFDLSSVAAGSSVTGCALTFAVSQVTAPTSGQIQRVRRNDWSEMGSSWAVFRSGLAWTAPGASSPLTDVDATSAVPFSPPAAVGPYTFPSIQALCEDAVQNRGGNLDLLIRQDVDQGGACTGACVPHEFCSGSSDQATATARPRLVLTYATAGATTTTTTTRTPTTTVASSSTTVSAASTTTTSSTGAPGSTTTLQRILQPDPSSGVDNQMAGGSNTAANYGAAAFLCVGNDQRNTERVLIHFDLGALGATARVTSCLLTLATSQVAAPTSGHIERLRRNAWSESASTWAAYNTGAAWTTPGAGSTTSDVDTAGAVLFAPPSVPGAFTFPSIQALCQDAVQNRAGSLDLLIRQDVDQDGACTGACASHEFCSRSSDWATPAERPKLVVGYVP